MFAYPTSRGQQDGALIHKHMENIENIDIEDAKWPNPEGQTIVYPGIHKQSKTEVDIKIICKREKTQKEIQAMASEAHLLMLLSHNNIIKIFDYFENNDYLYICYERYIAFKTHLIMRSVEKDDFMVLPPHLSLRQYVWSQVKNDRDEVKYIFREKRINQIASQLLHALNYLHNNGIILRDLDLDGIFLSQNSDQGIVKI